MVASFVGVSICIYKSSIKRPFCRLLDHYGTQLNFIQYYCLDVLAFLIVIVVLPVVAFLCCVKALFVRCFRLRKVKVEMRRLIHRTPEKHKLREELNESVALTMPF